MDDSSEPKVKSKSVSLPPELWARVEAKAEKKHGGNRSAYARKLFEADLDGTGPDRSQDGAQAFARYRAACPGNFGDRLLRAVADGRPFAEIARPLGGDDPKVLSLLRAAYDFLRGETDREIDDRIITAATALARTLNARGAREFLKLGASLPAELAVAETQGEYLTLPRASAEEIQKIPPAPPHTAAPAAKPDADAKPSKISRARRPKDA